MSKAKGKESLIGILKSGNIPKIMASLGEIAKSHEDLPLLILMKEVRGYLFR